MAKQKNRASRKSERERASRAEERGLPQAKPSPAMVARRAAQGRSSSRRAFKASNSVAKGTLVRVALGIVVALIVVYLISQSRKDDMLEAQELPSDVKSLPKPVPGSESGSAESESGRKAAETSPLNIESLDTE